LYVRRKVQERLNPPVYGWHNVRCPDFVAQEQIVFREDARKYEAGTHNLLGVVGMIAATKLVLEIGIENIAGELLRKREWIVPALQSKGYSVLQADAPPENAGGIVSFFKQGGNLDELHRKLTEARIYTSLRVDRKGRRFLRLSPHFYNTDSEIQRALDLL
jgi:cysteine desulfurase/selenocysteine lyase